MQNLEVLNDSITESQATELIFDGCRDNEAREERQLRDGYSIKFYVLVKGCEAVLRDPEGIVVALANVDDADC